MNGSPHHPLDVLTNVGDDDRLGRLDDFDLAAVALQPTEDLGQLVGIDVLLAYQARDQRFRGRGLDDAHDVPRGLDRQADRIERCEKELVRLFWCDELRRDDGDLLPVRRDRIGEQELLAGDGGDPGDQVSDLRIRFEIELDTWRARLKRRARVELADDSRHFGHDEDLRWFYRIDVAVRFHDLRPFIRAQGVATDQPR